MSASPARAAAFDILLRVEREGSYASELLHSAPYQELSPQDHGLTTELVMGALRWQSFLDHQIAGASDRAVQKIDLEVLIALRLAAYQLAFLDRMPARAAVNESVELVKRGHKRSAMPFTNAVLRKLCSPPVRPELSAVEIAVQSHPRWLVDRWKMEFGEAATRIICEYDQYAPETCIRSTDPAIEVELEREGVNLGAGKLLNSARRVLSGDVTKSAAFRNRIFSIQDEASQLVALMVGNGSSMLDCCAAPGGKTRILAERNPTSRILAIELHRHRARLLRKLVPSNKVSVAVADCCDPPTAELFECVLVDVPCSGTGTLARNPEIKWRLREQDLIDLQAKQIAILKSAMKRVALGGRLVYSTCSMEREENSDVVEAALIAEHSFEVINCRELLDELRSEGELAWPDIDSITRGGYLRTIPGIHPSDGFFAAVLRKSL